MRLKDSPAHRATVAEWEKAIDVLLDMLLQVRVPPRTQRTGAARDRNTNNAASEA
jgi:hypothetical protein